MGPLRSALAVARRQRRRRGVFVSLYRPCCGAAAAIARRLHGPAGPPNTHPPARPPAVATTEARAPATPFSFVSALEADFLARPIARPQPALCPSRGGWLQPRGDPRASASASASLKGPYPSPPRAQLGLHAVWVPGPRQRLSGCPSSSSPSPRNLPGRPASLLGCSAVAPSLRVAAAGLRLHRVAQAALLRAQGPQSCRELPLQGWLSCSRLDAA